MIIMLRAIPVTIYYLESTAMRVGVSVYAGKLQMSRKKNITKIKFVGPTANRIIEITNSYNNHGHYKPAVSEVIKHTRDNL